MESCRVDGAVWSACKPFSRRAQRVETVLDRAVDRAKTVQLKDIVFCYM